MKLLDIKDRFIRGLCGKMILCALAAVGSSMAEGGITLRPVADAIRWQTHLQADSDKPIQWRWEGAADCAYLTVTCHVERMVTGPLEIRRTEGEKYGTYSLGALANGAKEMRLYDLALELCEGEEVVSRRFARVAVLPASLELKKAPPSLAWRQTDRNAVHIVPYDSSWSNATLSAESASLGIVQQDAAATSVAPGGVSGFAPLDVKPVLSGGRRQFGVTLDFDGEAVWSATLTAKCASVLVIR